MVVEKSVQGFDAASNCGGVGASVSVTGEVVASKGKGQEVEIKAENVEVWIMGMRCWLGVNPREFGSICSVDGAGADSGSLLTA